MEESPDFQPTKYNDEWIAVVVEENNGKVLIDSILKIWFYYYKKKLRGKNEEIM